MATYPGYEVWNARRPVRRKVTPQQMDEIKQRRWDGEDPKALALEFGISANYIRTMAPLR